jgi:hypothetical protein
MDRIIVAQEKVYCLDIANTVMNNRIPYKAV